MSEKHLRLVREGDARPEPLSAFLADLTTICRRHGIAINDGAELYLMEDEDRQFAYQADADSRLALS